MCDNTYRHRWEVLTIDTKGRTDSILSESLPREWQEMEKYNGVSCICSWSTQARIPQVSSCSDGDAIGSALSPRSAPVQFWTASVPLRQRPRPLARTPHCLWRRRLRTFGRRQPNSAKYAQRCTSYLEVCTASAEGAQMGWFKLVRVFTCSMEYLGSSGGLAGSWPPIAAVRRRQAARRRPSPPLALVYSHSTTRIA